MIDVSYEDRYTQAESLENWLENNSVKSMPHPHDLELIRIYEGNLFMQKDYEGNLGESQILKCRTQAKLSFRSQTNNKSLVELYIYALNDSFNEFYLSWLRSQREEKNSPQSLQAKLSTEFN